MGQTHIIGSILGTAIGDAIGLPYEGLSRRRAAKLLGIPHRYRFFFSFGMVSDDTEHTCMIAQSLIAAGGNKLKFQHHLAWLFRFWLLSLPAGVGLGTLQAICRLWCGFSPAKSGVFSAGNGPAMRAAILGVAIDNVTHLGELVRISSRMTHTDPKAEYGAFAIALAARIVCQRYQVSGDDFLCQLKSYLGQEASEFTYLIHEVVSSVNNGESTVEFAAKQGLSKGVSGYVYHSVPVAIHIWLSHQHDFRAAIMTVVECGGDTDSNAAIVGGIVGAAVGKEGIPREWLNRLLEPSRNVKWMENLGIQLDSSIQLGIPRQPIKLLFVTTLLRNAFFLLIVLFHGFRRLLPPY
ncbi:MAG: ADP-ribosylglycohydrolase family protein [Calothrix sp. MO_167.B42]|nr:ADP-ribosylglycohydrolase family protein [Calothrix sp. MO_167.B42]